MTNKPDQPQPAAPNGDDIVALIDPKNEVAIHAVLALKHRLEQVELEQVVYRSFLNDHEERIRKLDKKHIALQKQVDAIDINLAKKFSGGDVQDTFLQKLKDDDGVQRLIRDKRGSTPSSKISSTACAT